MDLNLILTILQSISISLGVGVSTVTLISFLYAIKDGVIDHKERSLLGLMYTVLRVAMVLILITVIALLYLESKDTSSVGLNPATVMQIILVIALFVNAVLMTVRIMPSQIGPAIQAGTWYTLGFMSALLSVGLVPETVGGALLGYFMTVTAIIIMVNGVRLYLTRDLRQKTVTVNPAVFELPSQDSDPASDSK